MLNNYRWPVIAHRHRVGIDPWVAIMLDNEWDVLEKALSFFVSGPVVNPVAAVAGAQNKLAQLRVAKSCGFLCPETFISTNVDSLQKFLSAGPCITKSVGNCVVSVNGEVHTGKTRRVNPSDFEGYDSSGCPTLLQRVVEPQAMWRIVVVGKRVFGFRLYGDMLREESDSRFVEECLEGDYVSVPEHIERGLLRMCAHFSLLYASSDFIEDRDGHLWFIDLNPEG